MKTGEMSTSSHVHGIVTANVPYHSSPSPKQRAFSRRTRLLHSGRHCLHIPAIAVQLQEERTLDSLRLEAVATVADDIFRGAEKSLDNI